MREPTDKEVAFVKETVNAVLAGNKIAKWQGDMLNPYLLEIKVPLSIGRAKAARVFNELFHSLGVLPVEKDLVLGEASDYCAMTVETDNTISATFNVPFAKDFKDGDEEYQFTLKAIFDEQEAEGEAEEAEMQELIEGIKTGRLKSKSADGCLVLKAKFYNTIEAGEKTVEYRDFTEYNLKRTIGLKTIRFNLGYAKDAKRMRWEVKKVVLLDGDDNECDPFDVSDDFWPTTIAIYLGKRIG